MRLIGWDWDSWGNDPTRLADGGPRTAANLAKDHKWPWERGVSTQGWVRAIAPGF